MALSNMIGKWNTTISRHTPCYKQCPVKIDTRHFCVATMSELTTEQTSIGAENNLSRVTVYDKVKHWFGFFQKGLQCSIRILSTWLTLIECLDTNIFEKKFMCALCLPLYACQLPQYGLWGTWSVIVGSKGCVEFMGVLYSGNICNN